MANPSLTLLSLSTIFSVIGLAAVTIAVVSTNWNEIHVNRREIINAFNREPELNIKLKDAFIRDKLYFSRNYGLFHICFSDAVPSDIGSFQYLTSPCIWNKDYLPSDEELSAMSSGEQVRLWSLRGMALLYICGIAIGGLSLIAGIAGCWRQSTGILVTSAVFMIIAVFLLGLAMAAYHYINYLEKWTLDAPPFYKSWESILKQTTKQTFGLSYIASWVGICLLFLAAVFMLLSKCYMQREEEAFDAKHDAYLMPNFYDKSGGAMMPYGYNTYSAGAYAGYPPAPYGGYGGYPNAYYGYMTYGR